MADEYDIGTLRIATLTCRWKQRSDRLQYADAEGEPRVQAPVGVSELSHFPRCFVATV